MPENKKWSSFLISDFFTIKRGKRKVKNIDYFEEMDEDNKYPVITAKTTDNGVDGYYSEYNCEGECIIACGEANGMFCTYQKYPCWVMDTARIIAFKDGRKIDLELSLFLITIFKYNQYKFSYGRKAKPDNILSLNIVLPVDDNNNPDWDYMRSFVKKMREDSTSGTSIIDSIHTSVQKNDSKFDFNEWSKYKVKDIFKPFINGKGLTANEILDNPGSLVAVQSSGENNACMGYIDENYCISKKYKIVKEMCLTVARSGTSGFVAFQKNGCVVGDSAKAMILKYPEANQYHYLFIRTVLMANFYKFAYGRKVKIDQYMNMELLLPSINGEPDWNYMENYIKTIPYSDKI